jgi:uncharacterized protein YraI
VLQQFQMGEMTSSAPQAQMAVAYTLYGEDGSVVGQQIRPLESPQVAFPMPEGSGKTLRVDAKLANANGTALTAPQSALLALAAESAPAGEQPSVVQSTLLSVDQIVNVRSGPGTAFEVLGQISAGQSHWVSGRTSGSDWWQIEFNNGNGWVFGQLATVSGASDAVAVVETVPAVAAASGQRLPPQRRQQPPQQPPQPQSLPRWRQPRASAGGCTDRRANFGYGVQVHAVDNGQIFPILDSIGGLGFNWLKQQIEWKRFEADAPGRIDWPGMDEIVSAAGSRGVNVLFSVVNAPGWAREPGFDGSVGGRQDPQTYANFAVIAARFRGTALKAIEVWNEQNLHYEWGNKPSNLANMCSCWLRPTIQSKLPAPP